MNQSRREFSEKRNFIRMKVDTPAKIHLVDNDGQQLNGICRDLSATGMLVEVSESIAEGTTLEVVIASEHSHSPMLKARTIVRRSSPGEADSHYILGLEVIEMLA